MRRLTLICMIAASLAVQVSTAEAGTYHQYLCRTPAGAPVPLENVQLSTMPPYAYAADGCRDGGPIALSLDPAVAHASGQEAKAVYTTPLGVELADIALWRWTTIDAGVAFGTPLTYLASPADQLDAAHTFDSCQPPAGCSTLGNPGDPFAPENLVVKRRLPRGTRSFFAHARCDGGGTCPASAPRPKAILHLFAGDLLLRDDEGPKLGSVGGTLVAGGVQRGRRNLLLSVTDAGSGVYSARVLVGGREVFGQVLDDNGGLCRTVPRPDGARAFLHGAPCKPSVSASVDVDTSAAPDGTHELRIVADDASGNVTTLFTGQITIENGPVGGGAAGGILGNVNPIGDRDRHIPNGTSASERVRLTAGFRRCTSRRRCRFHRRLTVPRSARRRIVGRLRNESGVGIGNARLLVAERIGAGQWRVVDGVPTNRNGRYDWLQPAGASRDVELIYWAFSDSTTFSLSRPISRRSRPRVALRVSPRRPRARGRIRLTGAVSRDVIPPEGVTVVLQAQSPDRPRWLSFRTLHTDANGRFRATYRFRSSRRGDRFTFRAVTPRQAGYPFTRGVSRRGGLTRVRLR